MKTNYLTPEVLVVPYMVKQPICAASPSFGAGDYDFVEDGFDSDSD